MSKLLIRLSEGYTPQQVIDMIRDTKFNDLSKIPNDKKLADEVVKILKKPENKDILNKIKKLNKVMKEIKGKGLLAGILLTLGSIATPQTVQAQNDPKFQSTYNIANASSEVRDATNFILDTDQTTFNNWFEQGKFDTLQRYNDVYTYLYLNRESLYNNPDEILQQLIDTYAQNWFGIIQNQLPEETVSLKEAKKVLDVFEDAPKKIGQNKEDWESVLDTLPEKEKQSRPVILMKKILDTVDQATFEKLIKFGSIQTNRDFTL